MDSPGSDCCDVCDKNALPGLREENSLLDFFRRNRCSYSAVEAAKIISQAENISWSEDEAMEAVSYLVKTGKIRRSKNPLWKGLLTT